VPDRANAPAGLMHRNGRVRTRRRQIGQA